MAQTSKKFCSACLKEVSSESFKCPNCNGPLTILHSRDLVGEILDGRFEVLELLGKGGMGIVYRARHRYLERDCAIKVLRTDSAEDPLAVARFLREAKSASGLSSPHTVRVMDFGVSPDGLLYLVMELLEGESLAEMVRRKGSLPWRRAFTYAIHVCHSLQEAHARSLWHRDIKPDNIFIIREEGEEIAKVLDFGIAKWGKAEATATEAGIICGTPEYLSPEQARGKEVDGRTDIYSLGAVLYEALCGHPPFVGDTAVKILMCHIMDKPTPLGELDLPRPIPEQVGNLVMWALKKKARRRPASVEEFAASMQEALDTYPEDSHAPDAPRDPRSSPTGLQFAAMVAEEDTADEIVSEELEETTGDFMVSEERMAADLAIAQQSTTDSIYPRHSEAIEVAPRSLDAAQKNRRLVPALFGLLVLVALVTLAGWYYQRTGEPQSGAAQPVTTNRTGSNAAAEQAALDLAPSTGRTLEDVRTDNSTSPADVELAEARPLATEDSAISDQSSGLPQDISHRAGSKDTAEDVESGIAAPADVVAAAAVATDAVVFNAAAAHDVATSSPDVAESPSPDEMAKERERLERRRKRLMEKQREEKARLLEENRKKQAEQQRLAEEARQKKEEEERKAKERAKEKEEDEDDDYSRIPGSK